jgi:hypothetical protein
MARNHFTTLKDLKEQVQDWHETCYDDTCSPHALEYTSNFFVDQIIGEQAQGNVFRQTHLNDHAFNQLCGRLDIPAGWARDEGRCPDELRGEIVNWKLAHYDKRFLLRNRITPSGEITRAVLSNRYGVYNHIDFVDAISDAITRAGIDVRVWRPQVGDELRTYVLVEGIDFGATEHRNGNITNGDGGGAGGMKPAIYISNSEIGTGKVRVHAGLYRSYCMNGLIYGYRTERQNSLVHRGRSNQHLGLLVNEMIADAMNMSEEAATAFLETRSTLIEATSVSNIVERWNKKYGIVVDAGTQWLNLCQMQANREGRVSLFDVINHATDVAGGIESNDTRENMEVMAGELIHARIAERDLAERVR